MHLINQKTFDTFDEENIAISRLFLINLEPQLMFWDKEELPVSLNKQNKTVYKPVNRVECR